MKSGGACSLRPLIYGAGDLRMQKEISLYTSLFTLYYLLSEAEQDLYIASLF
jgi:hypothetical protein